MESKFRKNDTYPGLARFAHQDFFSDESHERRHGRYRNGKGRRGGSDAFTSGIIFTIAFGLAWIITGWWFWIFPMLFAGIIPAVEGLRKLLREREERRLSYRTPQEKATLAEKEILRIAKAEQGKVTPTMVALHSSLSVEEAEHVLDNMAKKGYASMHVTESGRIEYEFPDFLPRIGE